MGGGGGVGGRKVDEVTFKLFRFGMFACFWVA